METKHPILTMNQAIDSNSKENAMIGKMEALTIQEDLKENDVQDKDELTLYPYDRLTTVSSNPAIDIDVTKRETYLFLAEFREKFGMTKEALYKLHNGNKIN